MKCISCGQENYETVYEGKLRAGSYGKLTDATNKVIRCTGCGLTRLETFPEVSYTSDQYRLDYNDTAAVEDYFANHDIEQNPRIARIGIERFRNKVVLDFGCGGGSFLDLVKGVAAKTIAVEPFGGYHASLRERGHEVYGSIEECTAYNDAVDIVISFGVIEHINDPLWYLQQARRVMKPGATLYIETDNLDDVLVKLDFPEFGPFYYRTVHSWYFDSKGLSGLCKAAGFTDVKPGFRHGFGLSNTLLWLKERKPKGGTRMPFITDELDYNWIQMLEKTGMAELLHFVITK
jgi:SAM-dependent methyltransferase